MKKYRIPSKYNDLIFKKRSRSLTSQYREADQYTIKKGIAGTDPSLLKWLIGYSPSRTVKIRPYGPFTRDELRDSNSVAGYAILSIAEGDELSIFSAFTLAREVMERGFRLSEEEINEKIGELAKNFTLTDSDAARYMEFTADLYTNLKPEFSIDPADGLYRYRLVHPTRQEELVSVFKELGIPEYMNKSETLLDMALYPKVVFKKQG